MPAHASYDYAVVRVVPRVDREEFINAGVILFSKACHFLAACVEVDEKRLRAVAPAVDVDLVRRHLDAIPRICAGQEDAGGDDGGQRSTERSYGHGQTPMRRGNPDLRRMQI